MKAVILAGGMGSRLSEETSLRPKPMLGIGGRPILWHIMKLYSAHGVNDFIICCGYKGYVIKEYFANYFLHMSDVTFDIEHNQMEVHQRFAEPWRVTLVDTGITTLTGGRLKRVSRYLGDEDFCLTYGDGVADVDISKQASRLSQEGRQACHCHRGPAARAIRCAGAGRQSDSSLPGEAFRCWFLDQRRLFCPLPEGGRLHRDRRDAMGEGADGASGKRGRTQRFLSRRFLAIDGYPARPAVFGLVVAVR